jgi:hypothetical protein
VAFWTRACHRTEARPEEDPHADALVETYVEWREECIELEAAYQRWMESKQLERDLAYTAYRAALDREEEAAGAYGLAARQLSGRPSE